LVIVICTLKVLVQRFLTTLIIVLVIAGAYAATLLNILNKPTTVAVTQTSTQVAGVEGHITIEDMVGKTVKVPVAVRRVIALQSYWVEVTHLLGAGDKIVGIERYAVDSVWVPNYLKNKTVVGDVFSGINVETVISLKPDVVITDVGYGKAEEIVKSLEDLGIPVVRIFCQSFDDQLEAIRIIGTVLGVPDKAEELINYLKNRFSIIKDITSKIPEERKPRVLMLSSIKEGLVTVYSNSTWGRAVEDVGGINIALREFPTQAWPKVNIEKVLAWDPDMIIVVAFNPSTLEQTIKALKEPPWNMTKAVRNGKIYGVLAGGRYREAFLDWGPRMLIGYMQLARIIQPEYFKDLDWRKEADELLTRFYKMRLYITIVDARGKNITLPYSVERVAITASSVLKIVAQLRAFDKVVGVVAAGQWKDVLKKVVPNIESIPIVAASVAGPVNMEVLLSVRPDVVLTTRECADATPEMVEQIESLGIPVVTISSNNYTSLKEGVLLLGKILGKEERAKELVLYMDSVIAFVENRTKSIPADQKLKAIFILTLRDGAPHVYGWGGPYGEIIERAGLIDITKGRMPPPGRGVVPLETIIGWNPDIIFLWYTVKIEDIVNNPAWQQINAVKNRRVYKLPGISAWDCDYPLNVLFFAMKAYPDMFKDINFNEFYKEFTAKVYGVPLEPYYG